MRFVLGFGLVAIAATPGLAQRSIVLTTPDAEYSEPFSIIAINGVRPLSDGRVIVSDSKEKTVHLIDFRGTVKAIGRIGQGPNEYLNPSGLGALPGDTTALWDGGNRRFMTIRPDGSPGGELSPGTTNYGGFAPMLPRGADARGGIYFQGSPFVQTANGPAPADTVPVIRYDRGRDVADTVAFIHPQAGNATVGATPSGRGVSMTNGLANPLVPQDAWVVLPNGRIAVVRGTGYRVDIYDKRQVVASGPAVAWQPRVVDAEVKREITEERKRQFQSVTPRTRQTGDAVPIPPGALERMLAALEPWPVTLPPFMRDAATVRAGGSTPQIWVRRTTVKESDAPVYDVFDDAGRIVAKVQMPPRTRIVAIDAKMAYAIRTDDDDMEYLQRYKLPPL